MPARKRFEWRGDELLAQIEEAARDAVNETVDAARDDARARHTWRSDPRRRRLRRGGPLVNPDLEKQIVSEHAAAGEPNPSGSFGYTRKKGFYGVFHEEGTVREHDYPAIRPAADREFPTFVARLRRRLK